MTTDTLGGVWSYAMELAGALAGMGNEVLVASMGAPPDLDQRSRAAAIPGVELRAQGFKLEWMEDPWDDLARAGEWLLALAADYRPDLVHLNGYVHGSLAWDVPALVVGHSCVLSWWRAVKGEEAPSSWTGYRRAVASGLRDADRVVAPSAAMAADLHDFYGCGGKTEVVPNGRDPSRFRAGLKRPVILGAGRLWDEAKNLGMLERVARELPWPVHVAGETARPGGGAVGNPHVTEAVRALGRLGETGMAEALAEAAIFAHPARYEPFGLAPLEAGLSGCALVLADIASLREVWEDAAIFVPPDDPWAWSSTLNRLIEDGNLRSGLAEKSRQRARRYSSRAMALSYRKIYLDMTGRAA